jgi:NOL1/NOP2/fmu family ribosome biogenesis protein
MKLRIKGNSLRLRVSPSEMARLLQDERIEETIHFGEREDEQLTYALELGLVGQIVSIRYQSREITVLLSTEAAHEWAQGDHVGIAGDLSVGDGRLELLVEKDFACLDRREKESEDRFPHPKTGAVC